MQSIVHTMLNYVVHLSTINTNIYHQLHYYI